MQIKTTTSDNNKKIDREIEILELVSSERERDGKIDKQHTHTRSCTSFSSKTNTKNDDLYYHCRNL